MHYPRSDAVVHHPRLSVVLSRESEGDVEGGGDGVIFAGAGEDAGAHVFQDEAQGQDGQDDDIAGGRRFLAS